MKKINYLKVRTKNNSAALLKRSIPSKGLAIYRMGSKTANEEAFRFSKRYRSGEEVFEINTVQSCINSSNKLLMKQCFDKAGVSTATWTTAEEFINNNDKNIHFPVVVKEVYGYKNKGNMLCQNNEEIIEFIGENNINRYIVEKFYTYSREYRIHATNNGAFYALRKMLKDETDDENRWFRNDSNCVWILEDNELFDKPNNWSSICYLAAKAIDSVGLSIGCVDVKVQANHNNPRAIILETNSAPALSDKTAEAYKNELLKML